MLTISQMILRTGGEGDLMCRRSLRFPRAIRIVRIGSGSALTVSFGLGVVVLVRGTVSLDLGLVGLQFQGRVD